MWVYLFKTYKLQDGELYMKPALLGNFGMPKDRDCIHYKKKLLFPLTVKNLSMLAHSNSFKFLTIFTDTLYT